MEVVVVRVQLFAGWLRWGTYEPRTVDNMVNPIFRTATKLCLHDTEKTGPSENEADVGDFCIALRVRLGVVFSVYGLEKLSRNRLRARSTFHLCTNRASTRA